MVEVVPVEAAPATEALKAAGTKRAAKAVPARTAPPEASAGTTETPIPRPLAGATPLEPDPAGAARARAAAGEAAEPAAPSDPADAWTPAELDEVRDELSGQARELRGEIDDAENAAAVAQRDAAGEGPGDEADAGSKTFEREHEMSLANNSRDLLQQVERALARMEDGTYGRCESCGTDIPKPRLQAFPRATLCVSCKQREERR